ncbi:MAG TPA: hypothetical protein VHI73_04380 [Solirubrobacteraceae bacterium]|jgi:hypothetical protein|nr:hypothetical protein [Solirubrobacteraceae bacterium]
MPETAPARWWSVRRARSRKPATYRCPLCGEHLPAMADHILIYPEGDARRRRHAHVSCALAARRDGRLPTRDEWRRSQPEGDRGWRSLAARLLGRARPTG